MQKVKLNNANQIYLNAKKSSDKVTTSPMQQSKQVENGDNKIKFALAGLAAIGTAIAAGVAIYRHQNASKVLDEGQEQATKLLNGIDSKARKELFENIKTDKFTGVVQDTLKNGDKVTLEYADGILKKSTRTGSNTFEKLYETLENGTHKVTTVKNGKTSSVIIEDLQDAAKDSQSKLKALLDTKDNLSIEEFQKQADEIKFKSKNQQNEIQNIIKDKQKVLDEQKAAAEKAAKEAQEKLKETLERFVRNTPETVEQKPECFVIGKIDKTLETIRTSDFTDKNSTFAFSGGKLVTGNKELDNALNEILETCPDFRNITQNNVEKAKESLINLQNLLKLEDFQKASPGDQKIMYLSTILEDGVIKSKNANLLTEFGAGQIAKYLDLTPELNSQLSTEERAKLFNLVESMACLRKKLPVTDFPAITDESTLELLNSIANSQYKQGSKELSILNEVIDNNKKLINKLDQDGKLIYASPFNRERLLSNLNRDSHNSKVLDLTTIDESEDLFKYGFEKGTTKKDLRMSVYMLDYTQPGTVNDYRYYNGHKKIIDHVLTDIESYDKAWSKSFISPDEQKTFGRRTIGFMTETSPEQTFATFTDGRKLGYSKTLKDCYKDLFDDTVLSDGRCILPNQIKQELKLTDEEYKNLFTWLKSKDNIFKNSMDNEVFEFQNRKITIDNIREAVKKSQDTLFEITRMPGDYPFNEIVDNSIKINAVVCKKGFENGYPIDYLVQEYKKKTGIELPIIII